MKYKDITVWGIVCCSLFFFLQYNYQFYFYYIEQLQIFPFTWDYFWDTSGQPGGFAFYLSGFLSQFYRLPYVGALITTFLLLIVGLLMQRICRQIAPTNFSYLISLLPVLSLLPLHLDINYRLQGTVSYLLMLVFFLLYINVQDFRFRFLIGCLLLPVLLGMAGSVVFLLGMSILLWELLYRKMYWYYIFLILSELIFLFYLSVYLAWQGEYRMILLPDFYYEPLLTTGTIYYSWIAFPVCIVLIGYLRKKNNLSGVKDFVVVACQLLPILLFLFWMQSQRKPVWQENMKQDYYLKTEQWDKIIAMFSAEKANLQTINVLNLALASKGELGDKLFHYPQFSKDCLLPNWDSSLPCAIVLTEICFHVGDIASAQKFAFEGYVSSITGSSYFLKRLVQTNLIFGAYPVAEKYINILERTLFYRQWANEQRKYLYNDKLVNEDVLLGGKRKALIGKGTYAVSSTILKTLEQLAVNNPNNQIAFQYLLGYHILGKTLKKFNALYEKYYHTEVWPSLSISHQEAIVALFQDQPAVWAQKGVGLKVEQRYGAFNQDMNDKRGYLNYRDVMAASFGDTYWFYLVFKK
ncbi:MULTISPECIES: DUF6057 family protein [Parabacteroides]|jgi:hypothetical protein|uniref:DUF6057 family protein n=1 Tax=Parabacteroides TaxID=375288 RepID=UPI0006174A79|nr:MULTISPECIES: DUF6057 family protein [Parabacteroides]KKB52668.1 hypothetical protein HMPREF1212_00824 [Parabacteroides sp. HGS0025]